MKQKRREDQTQMMAMMIIKKLHEGNDSQEAKKKEGGKEQLQSPDHLRLLASLFVAKETRDKKHSPLLSSSCLFPDSSLSLREF